MRTRAFFSILFLALLLPTSAGAQLFDQQSGSDAGKIKDRDININLVPESPGPNQNVSITLESFSTNLNKANITWELDGKTALSGIGKIRFSFSTGDIGTTSTVSIAIIVAEGTRVDKKLIISPAQIDLLWEAPDAYVPPFYKGKALATQEARIKIVALPLDADKSVNPGNKVYNWQKNFKVDQFSSGYGKYMFTYRNNYLNLTDSASVSVTGVTSGGGVGATTLRYDKPIINFYKKSPAYGVQYQTLLNGGFSIKKGEETLVAEPFYFSKNDGGIDKKNMQYSWQINGKVVTTPTIPNQITVKSTASSGLAKVVLSITNTLTLFQEGNQRLDITLGK